MSDPKKCSRCGCDLADEPQISSDDQWVTRMLELIAASGLADLCEDCGDIESAKRERTDRERRARESWESSVPSEYRNTSISHEDYPRSLHAASREWIAGKWSKGAQRPFLGLVGPSGKCKTRVAAMMAKVLIWEGKRIMWLHSSRFQWAAQHQFDDSIKGEANSILSRAHSAQWLIFDDIGSLKSSEIVADELQSLLEHRTNTGMPMIWTSNETIEEMIPRLGEKARARILNRLDGFSNIIEL